MGWPSYLWNVLCAGASVWAVFLCFCEHVHTGVCTQDTPTEKTPPTPAHTRARQDPQTNTSHKHLPTLNGGATTVLATSHARVGGRAELCACKYRYKRTPVHRLRELLQTRQRSVLPVSNSGIRVNPPCLYLVEHICTLL